MLYQLSCPCHDKDLSRIQKKIPCRTGDSTFHQHYTYFFLSIRCSTNWAVPATTKIWVGFSIIFSFLLLLIWYKSNQLINGFALQGVWPGQPLLWVGYRLRRCLLHYRAGEVPDPTATGKWQCMLCFILSQAGFTLTGHFWYFTYWLTSAYSGKEIGDWSDIPAIVLFDRFQIFN